jgi:hypothetical protein
MKDPFCLFGPPELCTWRYAHGTCRFQTTDPEFARKLSQRSGARLVAWSINKGYLRIFEERIEPWRARELVTRYLTPTNGAFLAKGSRSKSSKRLVRVATAGDQQTRSCGFIDTDLPTTHDLSVLDERQGFGQALLAT